METDRSFIFRKCLKVQSKEEMRKSKKVPTLRQCAFCNSVWFYKAEDSEYVKYMREQGEMV